jgi:hypothetical protein
MTESNNLKGVIKKPIFLYLLLVIVLASIPIFQMKLMIGRAWQGVPPVYIDDDIYYYARIHEISDGHIFIGNPYFIEHNSQTALGFFIADWLAALPMIFSKSIIFTIIFNLLFWQLITFFLLYWLFRSLKVSEKYALLGALLGYLQIYWLLVRPVIMQTVFPFIILFWCIFFIWWKEPFKKKNIIFLSIVAAANFYIYSYSWQIVLITFGLGFIFLVFVKQYAKAFSLIKIGLLSLCFSLPVIIYSLKQIHHSYYWETMHRIGLVNTHLPSFAAYSYGRWIIIILILYFLTTLWFRKKDTKIISVSPIFIFFLITGCALLIGSASNIVIGKDLDIASHISRFTILWFGIIFAYYLFYLFSQIRKFRELSWKKITILSFLAIICLVGILRNFPRSIPFFQVNVTRAIEAQNYGKPLAWLNKNVPKSSVIWANDSISMYVPVLTKHYVLFTGPGRFFLVSSKELEERYLTSHYFDNLDLKSIEKDFNLYSGFGPTKSAPENYNQKVKICRLLKLNRFGYDCGEIVDPISFRGEKYFDGLLEQYVNEIKPNIVEELKKFKVNYIIKDKKQDINFQPEIIGANPIYQDERFIIYEYAPRP